MSIGFTKPVLCQYGFTDQTKWPNCHKSIKSADLLTPITLINFPAFLSPTSNASSVPTQSSSFVLLLHCSEQKDNFVKVHSNKYLCILIPITKQKVLLYFTLFYLLKMLSCKLFGIQHDFISKFNIFSI